MKTILTIIGARPQFIKAAPVSRALSGISGLRELIVHTGQHFDANMSQVFFDQMGIPKPAINLGINTLSHGAMTAAMLASIEKLLIQEKPDWVMVYGDTNSTLAGALAAAKLAIPVVHVEAGLRSYNMNMPEEINRILTDRLSSILFCPGPAAAGNLRKEGYDHFPSAIEISGDVMLDALMMFRKLAREPDGIEVPDRFILATVHRAENTDHPESLGGIIGALNDISTFCRVVFPVHPRTKKMLEHLGPAACSDRITMIPPQGYLEMIYLLESCSMVLTDSGGLQKEAYYVHKPCITVRDETEWTELVDAGYNMLCGSNREHIVAAYHHFLQYKGLFADGIYGTGHAAEHIAASFI